MPPSRSKRRRSPSRSPSPQLPLHLLTSLPSFPARTSTSTTASTSFLPSTSAPVAQDDQLQLRLPPHLAHGLVAHEATLIPTASSAVGQGYSDLAAELEDVERARGGGRTRMVRWSGSGDAGEEVWTDRYDLLHLLPYLPSHLSFPHPAPTPSMSTSAPPPADVARSPFPGFSDLPSDHEELFFFTPAERIEVERKKKRRRVEEERERRVRAVEERERQEALDRGEALADEEEGDELSPAQLALMHKLHATLSTSPNPSLLELRILANHGSDPKFAFLRAPRPGAAGGRESERERRAREVWGRIRRGEKVDERGELVVGEKEEKNGGGALGGLATYGSDSDDQSSDDEPSTVAATAHASAAPDAPAQPMEDDPLAPSASSVPPAASFSSIPSAAGAAAAEADEEVDDEQERRQREKQEKAREWARKRREKRAAEEEAAAEAAAFEP